MLQTSASSTSTCQPNATAYSARAEHILALTCTFQTPNTTTMLRISSSIRADYMIKTLHTTRTQSHLLIDPMLPHLLLRAR
jgi:hypothetical protein